MLGIFFVLYFASRLFNLLLLPIFTDESIYIYWAKFISTYNTQWFISLSDGKPPLLIWIISAFLKILPVNMYLLAGRLPSVFFGALALFGIYKLTNLLFKSKNLGLLAGFLYIISPFNLFYDRMALFDSMLTAMTILTIYFCLKTSATRSIKDAFLWGLFLGLAFLSKSTAIIFFLISPICFLLYADIKKLRNYWKQYLLFIVIALFLGQFLNNLQRVSHVYFMMVQKNAQFQQPWHEILENPIRLLQGNLYGIYSWLISYHTPILFYFGLFSFLLLLIKNRRVFLILFTLWFIPIFVLAFFGRELFPRYFLFVTPYFFIAISYGFNQIILFLQKKLGLFSSLILLILLPLLIFDYYILTDPPKSPLPGTDYNQYIGHHPSGYGLDKIFNYLDKKLEVENITVVTQGTFGLYPYAFNLYYWGDARIKIIPRWPIDINKLEILGLKKKEKFYLVIKEFKKLPNDFPYKIVAVGDKPGGKYPIILSEVNSQF